MDTHILAVVLVFGCLVMATIEGNTLVNMTMWPNGRASCCHVVILLSCFLSILQRLFKISSC